MLIKPPMLKSGDHVACVSSSWGGPACFPDRYAAGKKQLEEAFDVKLLDMPHTCANAEEIYNHPEKRAADLMQAFADPKIKAIISSIGGDDSIRMIPYLDLDVIKNNPKIFMGYSDTTISHFACLTAGLRSFYGPAIMAGFGENGGLFPYMQESVRKTLFSSEPIGEIIAHQDGWTAEMLSWAEPENQNKKRPLNPSQGTKVIQGSGKASGHLIGGCVEVLEMLKGTPLWPSNDTWDGAILFLEVSEDLPPVSQFTYFMRNYAATGVLERLTGIIMGRPPFSSDKLDQLETYDDALYKVVHHEAGLTNLPIMTQMDFGHTDPMFVIPFGATGLINCDKNTFSILDSSVTA